MPNFDDFDIAVKTLTAGSNMVVLDDLGLPSVMVALPRLNSQTLGDDMTVRTHPAWICGEKEQDTVYISKFQNIIRNHRAYSLPMQAPAVSVSFDEALRCGVCRTERCREATTALDATMAAQRSAEPG